MAQCSLCGTNLGGSFFTICQDCKDIQKGDTITHAEPELTAKDIECNHCNICKGSVFVKHKEYTCEDCPFVLEVLQKEYAKLKAELAEKDKTITELKQQLERKIMKKDKYALEVDKLKAELASAEMHWEHWQEMSNINLTEVSKFKTELAENIPRAKVQNVLDFMELGGWARAKTELKELLSSEGKEKGQ